MAGRRRCCISSRGFDGRAREAPGLRGPPLPRCASHSWCSCDAWPPAASCPAAAWSRRAGRLESPRRSAPQETPPGEGRDRNTFIIGLSYWTSVCFFDVVFTSDYYLMIHFLQTSNIVKIDQQRIKNGW